MLVKTLIIQNSQFFSEAKMARGNERKWFYLTSSITSTTRRNEFLPLLITQRNHFLEPPIASLLGRDARPLRLVEIMDDWLVGGPDVVPIGA